MDKPVTNPTRDVWTVWTEFVDRWKVALLIFLIGVTGISFHFVKKLKLETNLKRLLPSDYQSVKTLDAIVERLGGTGTIEFLLESNSWDETVRFATALNESLSKRDDIAYVDFKRPVEFLEKYRLLYLTVDDLDRLYAKVKKRINKEKLKGSNLVVDLRTDEERAAGGENNELKELEDKYSEYSRLAPYHQDDQNRFLLLKAYPKVAQTNVKKSKALYDSMNQLWLDLKSTGGYDASMTAHLRGPIRNQILEYDTIIRDVVSSAWITLLCVTVLILICFRNVIWLLTILVSFPISILWTFGIVQGMYESLNLLTVFLFIVLFGLGIDFGIHMLSRYQEERAFGAGLIDGIAAMFRSSGRGCATAGMTTSFAFLTLMMTDFKGFSEFGFITGLGVPLALLSNFIFLPILLIYVDKYLGRWVSFRLPSNAALRFKGKQMPLARTWVIVGTVITIGGVFAATKLEFEYDFGRLRTQPPDSKIVAAKYDAIPRQSNSPAIFLTETEEDALAVKKTLEKKMEEDTETPTIAKVRTVSDVLPSNQEEKIEILRDLNRMLTEETIRSVTNPDDQRRIRQLKASAQVTKSITMADIPESILRGFRDIEGNMTHFTFVYNSVELVDGRNTIQWSDDVAKVVTEDGKTFYSSSNNIIFAEMMRLMIKDGQRAILTTFFIIFLLVLLDFRNMNKTALVLNPLTVGVFGLVIFMAVKGIKLNFFNMVAIPSLIGMGIDYGVHLSHRYFQDPKSGPVTALFFSGPAIFFSGATTIVGYVGLVFANHPGLNSLGVVSVIGLSLSLLACFLVLPALFTVFKKPLDKLLGVHHPD